MRAEVGLHAVQFGLVLRQLEHELQERDQLMIELTPELLVRLEYLSLIHISEPTRPY